MKDDILRKQLVRTIVEAHVALAIYCDEHQTSLEERITCVYAYDVNEAYRKYIFNMEKGVIE